MVPADVATAAAAAARARRPLSPPHRCICFRFCHGAKTLPKSFDQDDGCDFELDELDELDGLFDDHETRVLALSQALHTTMHS